MQWSDYFELWKSYEDIAKHFNELIIRNRLQALGGLAATVAVVVGFFTQKAITDKDNAVAWGGLGSIFLLLALFWSALMALDLLYYNQLLQGSVVAITDLEDMMAANPALHHIDMSTKIENAVHMWHPRIGSVTYTIGPGIAYFYGSVLFALVVSSIVCFCMRKPTKKAKS